MVGSVMFMTPCLTGSFVVCLSWDVYSSGGWKKNGIPDGFFDLFVDGFRVEGCGCNALE